jgi:type II secretory ATPase GspE/PulE/Tfp pilus assembly ATPase PilB-like protein
LLGLQAGDGCTVYRPVGCPACEHLGYKGRMSILELLKFDSARRVDHAARQLQSAEEYVRKGGFVTMAEDGLRRVREGLTTIEEVGRVVDLTELIA